MESNLDQPGRVETRLITRGIGDRLSGSDEIPCWSAKQAANYLEAGSRLRPGDLPRITALQCNAVQTQIETPCLRAFQIMAGGDYGRVTGNQAIGSDCGADVRVVRASFCLWTSGVLHVHRAAKQQRIDDIIQKRRRRGAFMKCPRCGSADLRRSRRERWTDSIFLSFGKRAYRCRRCNARFHTAKSPAPHKAISPKRPHNTEHYPKRVRGHLIGAAALTAVLILFLLFLLYLTGYLGRSD